VWRLKRQTGDIVTSISKVDVYPFQNPETTDAFPYKPTDKIEFEGNVFECKGLPDGLECPYFVPKALDATSPWVPNKDDEIG
jgi:hypothetical protein